MKTKNKVIIYALVLIASFLIMLFSVGLATFAQLSSSGIEFNFVTNGGNQLERITVQDGEIIELPVPVRENHAFEGWFFDEALESAFSLQGLTFGRFRTVNLYAGWFTGLNVTFNTNGGNTLDNVIAIEVQDMDLPVPHRAGWAFTGWYTDNALTDRFNASQVQLTRDTQPVTLHASWVEPRAFSSWADFTANASAENIAFSIDLTTADANAEMVLGIAPNVLSVTLTGNAQTQLNGLRITVAPGRTQPVVINLDSINMQGGQPIFSGAWNRAGRMHLNFSGQSRILAGQGSDAVRGGFITINSFGITEIIGGVGRAGDDNSSNNAESRRGHDGSHGVRAFGDVVITGTGTTVWGGNGGRGGRRTPASDTHRDNRVGGTGGTGGHAVFADGSVEVEGAVLNGGNGGIGGVGGWASTGAFPPATHADGGNGGTGGNGGNAIRASAITVTGDGVVLNGGAGERGGTGGGSSNAFGASGRDGSAGASGQNGAAQFIII